MKILKYYLAFTLLFLSISISSQITLANNLTIYGVYKVGNLTFTSYSESWQESQLEELYLELLNNFHGEELDYLSDIFIFPNSPHGVNGYYKEDVYIKDGVYVFGENSYIELFNGDKFNTLNKIAPILSHEYGHHYTIYNILKYEGIYQNNYESSEYYKLRNLSEYPVNSSNHNAPDYIYHWDIAELLASDYVQLLGSPRAKASIDFKDLEELVKSNEELPSFYTDSFNLRPQINPYLPLAAEVNGLYNYFLKIAGYTSSDPSLNIYPQILDVIPSKTIEGEVQFTVAWSEADGYGTLEYTVVMSPLNNPFVIIPIKTVSSAENLSAVFGSFALKNTDGSISKISQNYPEEVCLKIYVKDAKGYIYSSSTSVYNLKKLSDSLTEVETTEYLSLLPKEESENLSDTSFENADTPSNNNLLTNVKVTIYKKNSIAFLLENSVLALLKHLKNNLV